MIEWLLPLLAVAAYLAWRLLLRRQVRSRRASTQVEPPAPWNIRPPDDRKPR
jgi:hypothetical protein